MQSIKELMDSQRTAEDAHTDKRLKLQYEVDMEGIRSSERIAEIQANSQVKQMEVVAQMMQQVIEVLRPAVLPPGPPPA